MLGRMRILQPWVMVSSGSFLALPLKGGMDSIRHLLLPRRLGALMPLCSPSVQLQGDLGVWPSKYYAHQRALTFLWRLRWQYWTKEAFQGWYDDSPDTTPSCLCPGWASRGLLARYANIMEEYGLTWEDLRHESSLLHRD